MERSSQTGPSGWTAGTGPRLTQAAGPRLFPEIVDWLDRRSQNRFSAQVLKRFGLRRTERVVARRPGRKGRGDLHYATWAAAYIERLDAGSRTPIKDLAAKPPIRVQGYVSTERQVSPETVRDILSEARSRGLLTRPPAGRAGGALTDKALRILRKR